MVSIALGFLLAFAPESFAEDKCGLRAKYGYNYLNNKAESYWASRKPIERAEGRVREANKHNERYQEIFGKYLANQKLTPGEAAEKAALDTDKSQNYALLLRLEAEKSLTQVQKVELDTLKSTNGCEPAAKIAIIPVDKRKEVDRARFHALVATNCDLRAAYLAEQKARGSLTGKAELAELEALLKTKGDRVYADFKRTQALGHAMDDCQKQEMTYIEGVIATPATNQEAKTNRLPAVVVPEGNTTGDGQNIL